MRHQGYGKGPLGGRDIGRFVADGFIRLEAAFPRELAEAGRAILWRATGCDPEDPRSWTRPVIRLGHHAEAPFRAAANTPVLHAAFDQLVGPGRWRAPAGLGSFPIRFPSEEEPGDAGWHVDASFGTETPDFMAWRVNLRSRGRALLLLFLFSDVGEADAPTRIRVGSHRDIARQLAPAGEAGLSLRELAADGFAGSAQRAEALATGRAGDVYLCHPFLVHAAQQHRGRAPRFLAQPPLLPTEAWAAGPEGGESPVERAIREALGG
ncbi:phytanoyl-CoA dioxygenase family protein [Siccirubricoccus phaeus]|uniref:phytanoyl-CoA dioxygenase family protein n=1 Tax=Siccirubricoccus phaeus TaxID=2595053 RepID=UPI0011F36D09|nr:phytanoyl-CoA dioxygenase family protein [Siccirubricoccus phaeus]